MYIDSARNFTVSKGIARIRTVISRSLNKGSVIQYRRYQIQPSALYNINRNVPGCANKDVISRVIKRFLYNRCKTNIIFFNMTI